MRYLIYFSILILIPLFSSCGKQKKNEGDKKSGNKVEVWQTTSDGQWKLQKTKEDLVISETEIDTADWVEIRIDKDIKYQQMVGFGGAVCDNSAFVLQFLSPERRAVLFDLLFGEEGIRLNYIRTIMGSTDNSFDWYTYDDLPDPSLRDEEMKHFSLQRDLEDVIPLLLEIKKSNPDLMLLGSPCSPPVWMKDSKKLFDGKVTPENYQALANYFVRYIKEMKALGLDVHTITIQNEPLYLQYVPHSNYPNSLMTAEEQADFIANYLGPSFKENNITTEIVCFDHNWDLYDYPLKIMENEQARKYVDAIGFHCYGGSPQLIQQVLNKYPDVKIYHTECSGGSWLSENFEDVMEWMIHGVLMEGINNNTALNLMWYLAVDENRGPITNGCPSCRGFVSIHSETKEITLEPEYYLVGHFSKFVREGAYRVHFEKKGDPGDRIHLSAFTQGQDDVIVAYNKGDDEQLICVKVAESKHFYYKMLPHSTVTFTW